MSKKIKPIVSSSPSGAALQLVDELENKNITLEEFLGDSLGKTLDEEPVPLVNEADPINEADNYDAIAKHLTETQKIPGASLVRSPDKPRPFERPPKYVNPNDAKDALFATMSEPEVAKSIVDLLGMGVPAVEIGSLMTFKGFLDGAYNPNVALLIAEPATFFVMALGNKANIEYKIEQDDSDLEEGDDLDKMFFDEVNRNGGIEKLQSMIAKKEVSEKPIPQEILKEVEERVESSSLLARQEQPNPDSLLSRG